MVHFHWADEAHSHRRPLSYKIRGYFIVGIPNSMLTSFRVFFSRLFRSIPLSVYFFLIKGIINIVRLGYTHLPTSRLQQKKQQPWYELINMIRVRFPLNSSQFVLLTDINI